jgi:hypothetical protein
MNFKLGHKRKRRGKRHGVNKERSHADRTRHTRAMFQRRAHQAARRRHLAAARAFWSGLAADWSEAEEFGSRRIAA